MKQPIDCKKYLSLAMALALSHTSAMAQDRAVTLDTIQVQGSVGPAQGYRATRSSTATRTDTPIFEIPRAISVIPAQVLNDLGEDRIERAFDFAGGVTRSNDFGGTSLTYNVRGFNTSTYYRNGFASSRSYNTPPDAAMVERIEILKGPDSGLFGRGEPGGMFNIVSKRPQAQAFTRVKFSAGRWDQYRASADINRPLNQDGSIQARLNVAVEDNHGFRDYQFNERQVVAPSVSWQLSASTKLTLDGEFVRNHSMFDMGAPAYKGDVTVVPIKHFYGDPTDYGIANRTGLVQAGLEHSFNADWTLRLAAQYFRGHMEGMYSYPSAPLDSDPERVRRSSIERDWHWYDNHYQLDLQGKFSLFGWQHQTLLGAEYEKYRNNSWQAFGPAVPSYGINIWNPEYGKPRPAHNRISHSPSVEESWAFNLQDQIHFNDNWIATLGARYERVTVASVGVWSGVASRYLRDAIVLRAGLLYKLTPKLNLFGNASRSFKPNGVAPSSGTIYAAETGVGYELGAKFDLFDSRMSATLAAFHISKQNVLTADPDPTVMDSIAVGEQRSRGIDLHISGNVTDALRVIAAYAYIDTEVTKDNNTPNTTGNRLADVPRNSASLLAIYRLGDAVELGGNVTYVGARRGNTSSTFESPRYRTAGLFGRWQATEKTHLTLNLNNLFDTRYYPRGGTSISMPGEPRNLKLTVAIDL